jgi:hypothetical protein
MRRPVYLVIALVAMWLIGMNAAAEGYVAVRAVHNPLSTATSVLGGDRSEVVVSAFIEAISKHPHVNLPLGIAQILLGGLMVLVSIKALVGRHASTSFALQVVAANALLMIVGYALQLPVRGGIVNAVVASGIAKPPDGMTLAHFQRIERIQLWWSFRLGLAMKVGALALCAFALTRRSARRVLAPVEPHPEER